MQYQRNYYEIMGVQANATQGEIKRKYREMARRFHPDLVADKAFAQTIFMQVNQAYRVLSDPERRAKYDDALKRLSMEAQERQAALQALAEVDSKTREADIAIMNGNIARARTLCESVIASDPRNVEALRIFADTLVHANEIQEAINAYRSVLEISPSFVVEAKLKRLEALVGSTSDATDVDPADAAAVKRHPLRRFLERMR